MNRNQIVILIAIAILKVFLGLHHPSSEKPVKSEKPDVYGYAAMQAGDSNRFRSSTDSLMQANSRRYRLEVECFQQY